MFSSTYETQSFYGQEPINWYRRRPSVSDQKSETIVQRDSCCRLLRHVVRSSFTLPPSVLCYHRRRCRCNCSPPSERIRYRHPVVSEEVRPSFRVRSNRNEYRLDGKTTQFPWEISWLLINHVYRSRLSFKYDQCVSRP